MDKLLLTVVEAGELLNLSRSRLYGLIRTGDIDSIKVGNSRRIPTAAVHAYVERRMMEDAVA